MSSVILFSARWWAYDTVSEHPAASRRVSNKDSAPKDSTEYLFFAFAINLDNWGEEKGKMTKQYVEDTILSYFGVTGINHLTLRKAWDYDGEKYTAYPDSVREPPLYILQEYAT